MLRAAIKGSHATIWSKVRAQADRAVRRGPPSYIKDDGHSGDEQLWQREVGNTLPLLAMAYVLSGEKTVSRCRPALVASLVWLPDLGPGTDRRHGPGDGSSALRAGARL